MTYVQVHCPDYQGVDVVRYGKQRHGPQRYRCNNTDCPRHMFLLRYQNQGRLPAVKHQMVDMALNGSEIRDTARVLRVSPTTVIHTLKKKSQAYSTSMKACSSVLMLSKCRSSSPTKSLAAGLGEYGTTVNDVNPGFMDTVRDYETHPGVTPEYSAQRARERHPIKRQPRPDELAFAVAFLCSERAGAITGSAIHVDGGAKMLG